MVGAEWAYSDRVCFIRVVRRVFPSPKKVQIWRVFTNACLAKVLVFGTLVRNPIFVSPKLFVTRLP
jgi:hypothetical protein